jgi:hypothetical protein
MFPQGLVMMRHVEQKKKKGAAFSSQYRYNIRGSLPKTPLDASPLKPKVHPNGIE